MMSTERRLAAGCLAVALVLAPPLARLSDAASSCGIENVERIVAVGDAHGAGGRYKAILKTAGLIDDKQHWVGGRTHLVQTGDLLDRGAESKEILDLLMKLEPEAQKAGGAV